MKSIASSTFVSGLAGLILFGSCGCQIIGGLEDLQLAGPTGGAGGTSGSGSNNASGGNASSSSSGIIVTADVECGGTICTVGSESSCCYDHYLTNSKPFIECVNGPAGNDGCKTSGGANGYETRIKCQWPDQCPSGSVCCGNVETISIVTWFVSVGCNTACAWPDTILCDPMSPSTECPMVNDQGMMVQTTCQPAEMLPTGYFNCSLPNP
jgi:hypothetical protein